MLQALSIPTHCWKDTSYDSILVIIDRLTLEEFIDGFHDGVSTERAPVTIRSWLTRMVHDEPMQIPIDAPRLLRLDRQLLRFSFHRQVLVPPVLLSSLTVVTTHAPPTMKKLRSRQYYL